ncbi:MAG: sulfatase-like hydrolase/transferase, partial [Saprospiraceae bacterium]|nr:sulfatase-like hydrolase/transferase [Saprospiraceae bacterium]
QSDAGQHFMLYLAYNAPHTPLQATEKYLARFDDMQDEKRKTYAAMVSAVDDGVGRVLQALAEQGIDEHTLIVFLSDNGGARNNASQNTPLRGFKSDLFEGGIRVPFAMRWKGVIPAGQQFNKPISSLDIMATIVAQNEIPIAPERPLDGVDLIPFLTGKKDGEPHDYLFWRKWEQDAMAVRKGHLKLVSNWNQKGESPYLFDVVSDISENKQLAGDNQQDRDDLMSNWNDWNAQLKDRVFPTLGADVWWTEAQR